MFGADDCGHSFCSQLDWPYSAPRYVLFSCFGYCHSEAAKRTVIIPPSIKNCRFVGENSDDIVKVKGN